MNYVGQQGTNARNSFNTAQTNFNTGLGTDPTFGASQQQTINNAINGSAPISTAQGLLNQSFTGPQSIDSSQYMPLMQTYQTDAQDTGNAQGVGTLLSQLLPQESVGDRNYDALIFGQNPIYQQQSQALQNDANGLLGQGQAAIPNSTAQSQQWQNDTQAFNTAANNYVTGQQTGLTNDFNNQITAANNAQTQLQGDIAGLGNGSVDLSSIPQSELGFTADQAAPTQLTSQYGADVFNQAVNPLDYLTYNPSQMMATAANQATPDQINQWNNIEAILQGSNTMTGANYQGANLSLNQNAFNTALQQAQAAMAAANATYLAGQQQPAAAPTGTGGADASQSPEGETGGSEGGGVGGDNSSSSADTSATDASGDTSSSDASADASSGGSSADTGGDSSGGGSSGGDSSGGGGADSGGDSGMAKGGFVGGGLKRQKAPPASPLATLGKSDAFALNQPLNPMAGPDSSNMLNPVGQMGYRIGGQIPMDAGLPGVVDSVPIRANAGEFVTTRPSVQAAGPGNLAALNRLNTAPPSKQHMVRNALHHALTRAALAAR